VFARGDNGLRLAIGDHSRDSVIGNRNVEWYGNEPAANNAKHRLCHLVAVFHEHDDAIAVAESEPMQRIRKLCRAGTKPRPAHNRLAINDRVLAAERGRVKGDNVRYQQRFRRKPRHSHTLLISCGPSLLGRTTDFNER